MSTLRGGAALNQNQIATLLGFDRTVVHRVIRTLIQEGLASEKRAESGRALLVRLTAKGNAYRERLIKERRAADEKLQKVLKPAEIATLVRLLKVVAEVKIRVKRPPSGQKGEKKRGGEVVPKRPRMGNQV